jgi:hypothetical protein
MGDLQDAQLQGALTLVDGYLTTQRSAHGWAGLSAAIVLDQEMIWSKGYGYANIAEQIPATPRTLYHWRQQPRWIPPVGTAPQAGPRPQAQG